MIEPSKRRWSYLDEGVAGYTYHHDWGASVPSSFERDRYFGVDMGVLEPDDELETRADVFSNMAVRR